jgi:hypothetical protein
MLLNDYSQLAVLSGTHTLRGAVTWKSIAQARHASPSASFSAAIVRAHEARYDQELIDVLTTLEASDFVFVRDEKNAVAGIVTTADVVHAYGERSLENPGSWAKLGWPLDRVAFVKRLDELRGVRNDVMHFNPDPVPPDSVEKLRNILSMLRQYCD